MCKILVFDIGGTNCRFAIFALNKGILTLEDEKWLDTKDILDSDHLLKQAERHLDFPARNADAIVLAMAGDIKGENQCALTNGSLAVNTSSISKKYNIKTCRIVNDFVAEAYSILTFPGQMADLLSGTRAPVNSNGLCRAIIGAGTGLGCSSLHFTTCGDWLVMPSEAGHCLFPFIGNDENDFYKFMREKLERNYITNENIVSGRGLELLHLFLSGHEVAAKNIGISALACDSETRRWFSRFFGRVAKNWVLTSLCRGGLWITGGLAIRNHGIFDSSCFWNEFYSSPKHSDLLATVPVYLVRHTNSGLWGAAQLGKLILEH